MWTLFSNLNDPFRLFDTFDRQLASTFADRAPRYNDAIVSFADRGEELILVADLPGINQEDVEITIEGEILTLRAERKAREPQGLKLVRSERGNLQVLRQLELPCRVDAGAVAAELKDGVLVVRLPKASEAKPRRIPVNASA